MSPRERLRQLPGPWLETYWESYLRTGFDYDNCYIQYDPYPVDDTIYGFDLASLPVGGFDGAGANVFNIAFASAHYYSLLE